MSDALSWAMRVYAKSCEDMSEIPDASVQCCVTSPPYFGLRDYANDQQIGGESTVAEYVSRLLTVFTEVKRVLRDDGTLWLNLGDSYAGSWGAQGRTGAMADRSVLQARSIAAHPKATRTGSIRDEGLKPKDLIGIPWTVAFALRESGWWLRDAIVWAKPNPMPSSVTDRCTSSYEMIFMLTKAAQYFADMKAVREPLAEASAARYEYAFGGKKNEHLKATDNPTAVVGMRDPTAGANIRNVWTIATTPYTEAHFATFPIELPTRCIRIGSRHGDVVLDPFMGSGTTAQAAEALGRKWVGYEISPEYHRLIAERTRQVGLFTA